MQSTLIVLPPAVPRLGSATQVGSWLSVRVCSLWPAKIPAACPTVRQPQACSPPCCLRPPPLPPSLPPACPQFHYTYAARIRWASSASLAWQFEKRAWTRQHIMDEVGGSVYLFVATVCS